MGDDMLLSIGMILKNEEHFLRDCLTSIKPILDAVHSELIIYDTGSTDATVQIAKEFTDQVYVIEWRNDFSWARNHTIRKAKGEWFMFVDADEMFTDTTDLIEFFNSGEHKKYNCASYRWRNFFGEGLYGSFRPLRLFRMDKDTIFKGKIHEMIDHKEPMKELESIADHHGYNFKGDGGEEKAKFKHERNVSLLLEMLEEDPTDTRTIGLLAQDYAGNDYEKAYEYLYKGLEIIGKNQANMHYHVFYFMIIGNYYTQKRYEDVVRVAKKYLKDVKYLSQVLLSISHHYANSLLVLNRYKESAAEAKKSLKYDELNRLGKLDTKISSHAVIPLGVLENRPIHAKTFVLASALAGDFDDALAVVDECKNEKIDVFGLYMQNSIQNKNWSDIPNLYSYALKCGQDSDNYHNIITMIEEHNTSPEIKNNISDAMANAPAFKKLDDDYIKLHKLRKASVSTVQDGAVTQLMAGLDYFLNSEKSYNQYYGDVILYAMKWLTNFSDFAEKLVIKDTLKLVQSIMIANKDVPGILQRFIEMGRWDDSSIKISRFISMLSALAFEQVNKSAKDSDRINFFEMTMRLNHNYLKMIYNSKVYSAQGANSLIENDAFIYYAGTAYECKDINNILGFVTNLRTGVEIRPSMKDIVWLVVTQATEEMNIG